MDTILIIILASILLILIILNHITIVRTPNVQGNCSQTTKTAIIITDNWDDDEVESWKSNLQKIESNGIEIEFDAIKTSIFVSK
jgi:hypothetical protein